MTPRTPARDGITRDELRSRYLGHRAIRRFAAAMGVPVGALKDVGDVGCIVGHTVVRVREADQDRAWRVAGREAGSEDGEHHDAGAGRGPDHDAEVLGAGGIDSGMPAGRSCVPKEVTPTSLRGAKEGTRIESVVTGR